MDDLVTREPQADPGTVDAVLSASRPVIAIAVQSLGAAAGDTTVAQYRALVALVSGSPRRLVDLAGVLGVTPSSAGRMCDRLVHKGLIRRQRASADRRAVLVSATAAGRQLVAAAAERHRALIADVLGRLPATAQQTVAAAFREFAEAAGEAPDSPWAGSMSAPASVPLQRPPHREGPTAHGRHAQLTPLVRARAQERA